MKSIVTGGAGFIGSHLVDKLLELNHDVICIDNESSQSNEEFRWNDGADNYRLDICNYQHIAPLFYNVDYVFHMAAESRIEPSIKNPLNTNKVNILGTTNILQAAREHGVQKVLYSSTSAAYGRNKIPHQESMYEDCLNPYSVSKVCGEKICRMYTELFKLKTVIFRYFNVYGPRQPKRGQYAPVIGIFLRQKESLEPLTIVGDGSQRRDFIHVQDVINANICAAEHNITNDLYGTVFNVGSGQNYSILEIANMISDKHRFLEPRKGEMKETLADISKIQQYLPWQPTVDLEDYIKSIL
jgi:UDP-glucose 4-epimerase